MNASAPRRALAAILALALATGLMPLGASPLFERALAAVSGEQLTLVVTKQPVGGTFAKDAVVRLYAQASASGGVLAYEWHRVDALNNDIVVGGNSAICDDASKPVAGTYRYYMKVTNTGADGSVVTQQSDKALVTVDGTALSTQVENGNFTVENFSGNYGAFPEERVKPWRTTHSPDRVLEIGWSNNPYKIAGANRMCAELSPSFSSCLFQEVATVPGKLFSWSLLHAARNAGDPEVMAVVVAPALSASESQALGYTTDGYPYGVNTTSYFNAIVNQVASEQGVATTKLAVGEYGTTYQGRPCYVSVISDTKDNVGFHPYSGTFTVPEGQGRTVFGFAAVYPPNSGSGNILANIAFAAGGGIAADSDVGYRGDGSLSVTAQAGYSYGIVEERGSAVYPVANVTYAFDGAAAAVYGGGWVPCASASKLVFGNLTPGKTYRVVGVPTNAANDKLGMNAQPANVLDESYYDSFTVKAVSGGSSSSAGNVQIQATVDAATKKAAIIVEPARADVDYALLSCPDGTAASADMANPVVAWAQGSGASLRFEGLERGASYLVVARPHGYFEVSYADAAESGVVVTTPGMSFRDIEPAEVVREAADAGTISVANTSSDQVYCVYNEETGARQANQAGNGSTLVFPGLDASAVYQVVTAPTGSVFSQGVRSYPAPPALALDFADEQAGTGTDGTGAVSTDVEYRVQAADGHWLVGDADAWIAGTGGQAVALADALAKMAEHGQATATLTYRVKADAGASSVAIESQLAIPARPAFDASACAIDYATEALNAPVGSPGAEVSADGWKSYKRVNAGSSLALSELGWNGAAKTLSVRSCASSSSFASLPGDIAVPARPASPTFSDVSLSVDPSSAAASIQNKTAATLEFRAQGAADAVAWTSLAAGATASGVALPVASAFDVRFSATASAFASRPFTLSASTASLDVAAPDVTNLVYGYAPVSAGLTVTNGGTDRADILDVTATGEITIAGPQVAVVEAGAADSSLWTVSPKQGLDAGSYRASVTFSYRGGDTDATIYQAVYEFSFIVDKAVQDPPAPPTVVGVTDAAATVSATLPATAPAGATLEYSADGRAWQDSGDLTGLVSEAEYEFAARVKESANYYASDAASTKARTAHAKPEASELVIDYINETLSFAVSTYEVSAARIAEPAPEQLLASGSSVSLLTGGPLYIRAKATPAAVEGGLATPASPWCEVMLPARPVAPSATTLPAYSSRDVVGGTLGVSGASEFEFRTAATGSWVKVPASSIADRPAGAYEVRIPATASSFASATVDVAVGVQMAYVSFDAAGGDPAPVEQTVQVARADGTPVSARVTEPTDVSREGYTLEGWFAPEASAAWDFANGEVTADLALAASWTANSYTVRFNPNAPAGAVVEGSMDDQAFVWDEAPKPLSTNRFSCAGWEFQGWAADAAAVVPDFADRAEASNLTAAPDAVVQLHAVWKRPAVRAVVPLSVTAVMDSDGSIVAPDSDAYGIRSTTKAKLKVEKVHFQPSAGATALLPGAGASALSLTLNGQAVAQGVDVALDAGSFTVDAWPGTGDAMHLPLDLRISLDSGAKAVYPGSDTVEVGTLAYTVGFAEGGTL